MKVQSIVAKYATKAKAIAALAMCSVTPVIAADLDLDCCADLEQRIAELESTAARKANRKVSLAVSGHVNQALLLWDDGLESDVYVVGNKNDQTHFHLSGDAAVTPDLTSGFTLTLRLRDALSDEVSQLDDDSGFGFVLWEANWFFESRTLGRLTLGQAPRASNTAPESDLSATGVAGYAGVQDMGGGFFLRRNTGQQLDLSWGDLYNHLNGDTANVIRYDTPVLLGFVLSASYGEDDIWDIGARFDADRSGFKLAAAIAYTRSTDANGLGGEGGELDSETIVGSAAVLHEASGLNALIAAGQQAFNARTLDADGVQRTPADASYIYTKLGWIAHWSPSGPTSFYGEYGHFKDFATAGLGADAVASLAAGGTCATPGTCRVSGNTADVWGLGVVQTFEAAEMKIYLGYRHHEADFELLDRAGQIGASAGLNDFQTVTFGSLIAF